MNRQKKILVMSRVAFDIDVNLIAKGNPSHIYYGMSELLREYDSFVLKQVRGIFDNTLTFVKGDFDVLYMHNWNPFRFFPLHIVKALIPSTRKKKVICLCHAGIFGKGHSSEKLSRFGWAISWMAKGYDELLFFSPKSLEESVNAGVSRDKCHLVHWGVDLPFEMECSMKISADDAPRYWISTGKENRDFQTMEEAREKIKDFCELKILCHGMMSSEQAAVMTANSRGVIVIPSAGGLNYCTGLTCVLEALALGKPIVAVRNPYYPFDIEAEGCGIYVDLAAPQQIVDAIFKIEGDTTLYSTMCQNARKLSNDYNMECFKKELIALIES